jgi:ABC-type transporter MlaC component
MTGHTVTRGGAIGGLFGLAMLIAGRPAHAASNGAAEQHVLINTNAALDALANPSVDAATREAGFRRIIMQMADVPRIAIFVLGRAGLRVRADPALRAQWLEAFEDHAIAVYQDQLERYAGSRLQVTGSLERVAGRDVVVRSEIRSPVSGRVLSLQWRVLLGDAGWKVTDVSFVADGAEIWLAQQQQSEFALQLDRGNGDINALIASVRGRTVELRRRTAQRTPA